jgi:hypothetical protein
VTVRPIAVIGIGCLLVFGCGSEAGEPRGTGDHALPNHVPPKEALDRDPFMGVSCRRLNSFACDRVGLAVWLSEPAVRVDASIEGHEFELDDPESIGHAKRGQRRAFAGFLQPAGLVDGPLQLTPDASRSRWIGREPASATVRLRVTRADGSTSTTKLDVGLRAGWG